MATEEWALKCAELAEQLNFDQMFRHATGEMLSAVEFDIDKFNALASIMEDSAAEFPNDVFTLYGVRPVAVGGGMTLRVRVLTTLTDAAAEYVLGGRGVELVSYITT